MDDFYRSLYLPSRGITNMIKLVAVLFIAMVLLFAWEGRYIAATMFFIVGLTALNLFLRD